MGISDVFKRRDNMYSIFLKLCETKGVTAYKVAKDIGISRSTFTDWKMGRSSPKEDKLKKIAKYFGVSSEYLRTGEQKEYYVNEETAQVAQEIFENKELRLLFDAARDAKPDDLKTTRDMLMALKKKEKKIEE